MKEKWQGKFSYYDADQVTRERKERKKARLGGKASVHDVDMIKPWRKGKI